jgi:tellurite resistance protein TehA-like permease
MALFRHGTSSNLRFLLRDLGAWFLNQVTDLHPDCFALVMATGIISDALFLQGYHQLSGLLFLTNALTYPWLAILTLLRAILFPWAVWMDLISPRRVFAFFTLVASNGVFGAGIHLRGAAPAALHLWILALLTWVILIYFSFGVLTFRNTPARADVIDGGWLLGIVGTEALVILGALIAPSTGELGPAVFVLVHMLWGVGIGLYAILVALIAYRIFFFEVGPHDLTPVLWVVMGAAAISTNGGSTLILTGSSMSSLVYVRPFIEGVTLIMWAWATWWIPLLVLFGIWKHGVRRVPLTYTRALWSILFPLGMYSVASLRLSLAADFLPLRAISLGMLWISVAAWIATVLGLAVSSWRSFHEFRLSVRQANDAQP